MKRKVIQIADKTFVISLPSEWVKRFNISKGDEIDLKEFNDGLIISSQNQLGATSSIRINIANLNERVIRWYLSALHKAGYDEIEINYIDKDQLKLIYELMKNLFTGFNIISETKNVVVLKSISKENKEEFDAALRRSFRITISMGSELIECLKTKNYERLPLIKEKELLNNQLTNFCERLVNKHRFEKSVFLYTIIWNLEKICDNYKYIINELGKQDTNINLKTPISKELINIFELANNYLEQYYDLLFNFDIKKLNTIDENKKQINSKTSALKLSGLDKEILNHLIVLITQTTDFSASIIAMNV
ncbi:phosphate uptake regulator PhoU [Candidatus Woesearchaeota archaeon]|nr:phosphate uptake regulator PhoU [Candidatus Woesearchaeota archaeon]